MIKRRLHKLTPPAFTTGEHGRGSGHDHDKKAGGVTSVLGSMVAGNLWAVVLIALLGLVDTIRFGYSLWVDYFAAGSKRDIGDTISEIFSHFNTFGGSVDYLVSLVLHLAQSALMSSAILLIFAYLVVTFVADKIATMRSTRQ